MRTCTVCGEEKEPYRFAIDGEAEGWLSEECNECIKPKVPLRQRMTLRERMLMEQLGISYQV